MFTVANVPFLRLFFSQTSALISALPPRLAVVLALVAINFGRIEEACVAFVGNPIQGTMLAQVLWTAFLTVATYYLLTAAFGRRPAPGLALGTVFSLVTMFLVSFGFVVGLILLAVPGVMFIVYAYFANIIAMHEGVAPMAAIRRSWGLVKGNWWRTFGALVLPFAAVVVLIAVVSVTVVTAFGWAEGREPYAFTYAENAVTCLFGLYYQAYGVALYRAYAAARASVA